MAHDWALPDPDVLDHSASIDRNESHRSNRNVEKRPENLGMVRVNVPDRHLQCFLTRFGPVAVHEKKERYRHGVLYHDVTDY